MEKFLRKKVRYENWKKLLLYWLMRKWKGGKFDELKMIIWVLNVDSRKKIIRGKKWQKNQNTWDDLSEKFKIKINKKEKRNRILL